MHRFIRRVLLATTCLAAPIASGPAIAQFNLYPAGATSVFVPYVNGAMNYVQNGVLMNRAPQLWVRLDAGSNVGTTALFTMDTGSTGIIASSEIFPTTGQQSLGSGSQYYSSSGVQLNGQFYATTVNIMNGNQPGSTAITTASVVALQAQTQTCRFTNKGCQASAPGTQVRGVAYMGVGFDRGDSAITPTVQRSRQHQRQSLHQHQRKQPEPRLPRHQQRGLSRPHQRPHRQLRLREAGAERRRRGTAGGDVDAGADDHRGRRRHGQRPHPARQRHHLLVPDAAGRRPTSPRSTAAATAAPARASSSRSSCRARPRRSSPPTTSPPARRPIR